MINKPNHHSLSHILGFAVTVAIWLKEVVACRDFILGSVTTFWVMSLVGIYPGRASGVGKVLKKELGHSASQRAM